jgi:hypothetical protein|tara:strand:- start:27 stop:227 length:201 start_codon:yes stop_codon:yes gene_type:complete
MEDKFKSVGDILRDILPKEVFETPTIPQQIEMIFAPPVLNELTYTRDIEVLAEWFGYEDNDINDWR